MVMVVLVVVTALAAPRLSGVSPTQRQRHGRGRFWR